MAAIIQDIRGLAVIMVNHFNHNDDLRRKNAEEEKNNYVDLFKTLNFDIEIHEDRTFKQMEDDLDKVAKSPKLVEYSIIVIAMSSHGGELGIFGNDVEDDQEKGISDEAIKRKFNGKKCPMLRDKPKLILRNGCRCKTKKFEKVVATDSNPHHTTAMAEDLGTDFLTICSSVDKLKPFKQMETASHFIPILKEVIVKNPGKLLFTLLPAVNEKLINDSGSFDEDLNATVQESLTTNNELTKDLIFNVETKSVFYK